MDGASFPAEHMQQISQVSAAEVELRRNLVQFAPHLVCKLDELLQEERSKMRQQEYEMMYLQEEYQSLKDVFQQRQQDLLLLKAAKDHAENQCDYLQQQYARVMQQFGGGGGAGFGVNSPIFVPPGGLGAVDGGGMLGDIDAGFKGLDLDGLDNGNGGVFGSTASWGGWGAGVGGRAVLPGSGAGVGFSALDSHGLGAGGGAVGAWTSLNQQGVVGAGSTFQLPASKLSSFSNVPSMNSLPTAAGGLNAAVPAKKKSPKLQGADAATSFSSANSSALPSSSAQAAKPPASFAQVAAEKAKAPPVAPKATALSSGQQQALKAPTSSSASSSSSSAAAAAAASSNAAGAQASGQAVLRMRGLPYSATENDLVAFFEGFDVVRGSVRFGTTVDGRPSGEGWVGFSSLSEAQRAMKDKDRQHIGDRYVEIFLHQVGDTVFGQKFARGGRGGGGSDGGSFKHEGGAGGDSVKMNSGDIFKKLSREVIETGLPASDVKESLHKLQDEGFTLDKITREQLQERVVRLMKEKETWREGGGSSAGGKRSGGSSR